MIYAETVFVFFCFMSKEERERGGGLRQTDRRTETKRLTETKLKTDRESIMGVLTKEPFTKIE